MQTKVLEVINDIRASKNMEAVVTLNEGDKLRDDLGLTSFDLAELTVRIEDGLVNTVGEIYAKLS